MSIEQVEGESQKGFWTKKKILITSLAFLLTIGLIVLSIIHIAKPINLFTDVKNALHDHPSMWTGMFTLLVGYIFINFFVLILPNFLRLRRLGIFLNFKEQLLYVLTMMFLKAVTPGALITEPYTLFWLKTRGVTTAKGTAIVWVNDFIWHTICVFIAIPSFIIFCIWGPNLFKISGAAGIGVFVLVCIGFSLDVGMFAFFIFMGSSKHFHYFLSRCFNTVKKWLHLKYHTKSQTQHTYIEKAILQKEAKILLTDWKSTGISLLIYGAGQILLYSLLFCALQVTCSDVNKYFSYGHVFNTSNIVTMANRYLPIPGGEGITQWELNELLKVKAYSTEVIPPNEAITNGIFTWRFFSSYLTGAVGLIGFVIVTVKYSIKIKRHNTIIK